MKGRYCLESTLWLARQLRNGHSPDQLRTGWQARRYALTGFAPARPRDSFRKAVCKAQRINEQREEGTEP